MLLYSKPRIDFLIFFFANETTASGLFKLAPNLNSIELSKRHCNRKIKDYIYKNKSFKTLQECNPIHVTPIPTSLNCLCGTPAPPPHI